MGCNGCRGPEMTKPRIRVKMGRQRINAQGRKIFDPWEVRYPWWASAQHRGTMAFAAGVAELDRILYKGGTASASLNEVFGDSPVISVKGNCNNLQSSIEEWQACPVCEYLAKYPTPLSWRDYTWNLIG